MKNFMMKIVNIFVVAYWLSLWYLVLLILYNLELINIALKKALG